MFRISILFPECQANVSIDLLLNELFKLIIILFDQHLRFMINDRYEYVRARFQKLLTKRVHLRLTDNSI